MAKVKAPTIKLDAARVFYLAERTKRLFSIMQELDELIEVLDDTGRLESANFLITSFWEEERAIIQGFEDRIDDAFEDGLYGRDNDDPVEAMQKPPSINGREKRDSLLKKLST